MPRVPRAVSAVMAALQFPAGRPSGLSDPGLPWHDVLDFADRSSLTLVFGALAGTMPGDVLPGWVRAHIALNLAENTERCSALSPCRTRWEPGSPQRESLTSS